MMTRSALGLSLAMTVALAGCNLNERTSPGETVLDGGGGGDAGRDGQGPAGDGPSSDGRPTGDAALDSGGDSGGDTSNCTPEVIDCDALCGPVRELCSGVLYQCGGCEAGLVCDLFSNTCIEPLISCADLGAECGKIRNSCGERLDCGNCPMDQECDPDTNTCVPCDTTVSCQDLGYECGQVWLGCGPPSNTTGCGSCADGVCNTFNHLCEPACPPGGAENICTQALLNDGIECGLISDSCGGVVNCGVCPKGQACGIGGVANRCEPEPVPEECLAQGRECGTIESICGGQLSCGECIGDQVCNPNGKCGDPCLPQTDCALAYPGHCGQQLDDGCGGLLNCGCPAGEGCDAQAPGVLGSCVPLKTCADYAATGQEGEICSNGASAAFPRGDGQNLSCPCYNNRLCVDGQQIVSGDATGSCCTDTSACDGTSCTVANTCTGVAKNCCASNEYCDSSTDTCQPRHVCADYTDRHEGDPCSRQSSAAFPRGDGQNLTCNCLGADLYCTDGSGSLVTDHALGSCCLDVSSCDLTTSCRVENTCVDGRFEDCCGPDEYCDTGSDTCVLAATCQSLGATGQEGDLCSNGGAFDRGDGVLFSCPCASGLVCIVTPGDVAAGSETGTCCANTASCGPTSGCSEQNTCTLATINCCTSTQVCDSGIDECVERAKVCDDHGALGEIGQPCNVNPGFEVGDGTYVQCGCATSNLRQNNRCVNGVCTCEPNSCDCTVSGTSDGCGDYMHCECTDTDTQVCNPATKACQEPWTCADHDATGEVGASCGTFPRGDGSSINCPCSTSDGWDNNTCVNGSCVCLENECGTSIDTIRDGCGGFKDCGSG